MESIFDVIYKSTQIPKERFEQNSMKHTSTSGVVFNEFVKTKSVDFLLLNYIQKNKRVCKHITEDANIVTVNTVSE